VRHLKLLGIALFLAAALFAVAACGGEEEAAPPSAGTEPAQPPAEPAPSTTEGEPAAAAGGTYRVEIEGAFSFYAAFDPTGEYLADAWGWYSDLLLRSLMGYRHTSGNAGNEVLPDLADGMPEVSSDGLTYTFKIKQGVQFGPPVSRQVTSADVAYALRRLADPALSSSGYPNYYTVIDGFADVLDGKADTIAGIETPDPQTIVFHLTQPTGDFLLRMAMPATAPIPEEVAKCSTENGEYGRYVISSGPYMLEGSDQLDISSCDAMQPIAGFDPERFLTFVRNPNYDPATDSEMRENLPDRFEFTINTNTDDIFDRVKAGLIDDTIAGETPKILREYIENDELSDRLKAYPDDSVFYVSMRLTTPPLDDLHVRKAVSFVLDKAGMRQAIGGPTTGEIATHFIPPSMSPGLADYNPFPSTDDAGDVAAAMEEMKQSRYDTDKDGLCDAPECQDVLLIAGPIERDQAISTVIAASLEKIGIGVEQRTVNNPSTPLSNPKSEVALSGSRGWSKDYADPSTYFVLFLGRLINPPGPTPNAELVGLTPEKASAYGIPYPTDGIESIDADYDACLALSDAAERQTCWEALDKRLTEEIVPIVPWLWRTQTIVIGPAVTQWDFDQFSGGQAWAHVAVDPSKQS
jgi:peptide/nickel transport system substrate-binding protein